MDRRRILQFAGLSALSSLSGIRVAYGQSAPAQPRLIVVMLRGAMDGLSLVAPYTEDAYYQERPTIAIARPGTPDGLLPLTERFGLHPAFAPLLPHWEAGQLAFIHASGSPDGTRSHFDAQDYMESATPGRKSTPDGWLNRLAGVIAGPRATPAAQRLQAVSLGPVMPRIFAGEAAVASLASGNAALRPSALDRPEVAQAVARLYDGDDRLSQVVREAAVTRGEIMGKLASDDPKADMGALPLNALPVDATHLGQLMARDARIRLAFMPVGGWDTHANQGAGKGQLANRFGVLAQSLAALAQSLGPRLAETSILVMSEFGRTVRQNGTLATDHGHGNVAFVLGGGVKGGRVLGEWPGLDPSARYEGRDLAITTDFRDIIAELLEERFRLADAQLARVLPAMERRKRVGLFA
ncbi:hypothetical protein UC35_01100 [Ramlibacter tataouinensis]|uniref:DUF1501 domain-containing protein n=1 Tax=Ramlibacter tataouinensis TaxID=94132 RepID=A0A127JZ22_9BURK|nr:hypothetical protein UC35_01100 [Ramlibacter tataouinensis]